MTELHFNKCIKGMVLQRTKKFVWYMYSWYAIQHCSPVICTVMFKFFCHSKRPWKENPSRPLPSEATFTSLIPQIPSISNNFYSIFLEIRKPDIKQVWNDEREDQSPNKITVLLTLCPRLQNQGVITSILNKISNLAFVVLSIYLFLPQVRLSSP